MNSGVQRTRFCVRVCGFQFCIFKNFTHGQWHSNLSQVYGFLYCSPFRNAGPLYYMVIYNLYNLYISHLQFSAKNRCLAYPPRYCWYSYLLTTHGCNPTEHSTETLPDDNQMNSLKISHSSTEACTTGRFERGQNFVLRGLLSNIAS